MTEHSKNSQYLQKLFRELSLAAASSDAQDAARQKTSSQSQEDCPSVVESASGLLVPAPTIDDVWNSLGLTGKIVRVYKRTLAQESIRQLNGRLVIILAGSICEKGGCIILGRPVSSSREPLAIFHSGNSELSGLSREAEDLLRAGVPGIQDMTEEEFDAAMLEYSEQEHIPNTYEGRKAHQVSTLSKAMGGAARDFSKCWISHQEKTKLSGHGK